MSLTQKSTTLLLVAVLGATALSGCGGETTQSGSATKEENNSHAVTVWTRAWDAEKVQKQANAYQEANPDAEINVVPVEDDQYLTKLANSIRAGSSPDLLSFDIVNATLLATQEQLLDITDRVEALDNLDNLIPAGLEIGAIDGSYYSLPLSMQSSQMMWNKKLFEQAGLDPEVGPKDLGEVRDFAEKIQALGGDVSGFSTIGGVGQAWTGFPSAWADGGEVFTEPGASQKATFNDPAVISMVEWYQGMWEDGLMQKSDQPNQDPGNVGQQNAVLGNVGIVFSGANTLAEAKDDFNSAAGIPGFDGKMASFAGGMQAGIPATAKNVDGAWDFLKWLISDEEAAKINVEYGFTAPDLAVARELATSEWEENIVSALEVGKLPRSIAYFATVNDPNGPWAQHSQAVIFQGADPQSEMDTASEQATQLIEDAYSQVG